MRILFRAADLRKDVYRKRQQVLIRKEKGCVGARCQRWILLFLVLWHEVVLGPQRSGKKIVILFSFKKVSAHSIAVKA
jgi:hypothetical protein